MARLDCCRPMPYDAGSSLVHNYDCAQGKQGRGLTRDEWETYKTSIRLEAKYRHPSAQKPGIAPVIPLRRDEDYIDAHIDDDDDRGAL